MVNDDRRLSFVRLFQPLFVVYLTISGNFLAGLFGCQMQRLMAENTYMRHILGFCTLFFLVVLVSDGTGGGGGSRRLPLALGVYALFTLTNRMRYSLWLVFMVLLLLLYVVHVVEEDTDAAHPRTSETLLNVQVVIGVAALTLVAFGVPLYLGDKRREYGADFSLVNFLIGDARCRNNGDGNIGAT